MVRYLIGARRGHGKHRVPGVGRDVGGQNLGVGQGDWAAPQRHQNAAALGVGGKAGGGGKVGTCGSSGTGRPRGSMNNKKTNYQLKCGYVKPLRNGC